MTIVTRSTPLIETETGTYPVYLSDVFLAHPNTCFPKDVTDELLIELGYEVVKESDVPAGDIVTEVAPKEIDGEWYRQYEVRSHNEDEKQTILETAKNTQLGRIATFQSQQFAKGFPYKVDGEVYHVQVRNSDRSNIDSLRTMAKEAKERNDESWSVPFRVWENVSLNLSPDQMINLADTAFIQVSSAYQRVWAFKDQVTNAKSTEEFPEDYETLFNNV